MVAQFIGIMRADPEVVLSYANDPGIGDVESMAGGLVYVPGPVFDLFVLDASQL